MGLSLCERTEGDRCRILPRHLANMLGKGSLVVGFARSAGKVPTDEVEGAAAFVVIVLRLPMVDYGARPSCEFR